MKENKGVSVTKSDIRKETISNIHQELISNTLIIDKNFNNNRYNTYYEDKANESKEVGSQYENEWNNLRCHCIATGSRDRHSVGSDPKQVYAFMKSKQSGEIKVGRVRTVPKKKVRKIYLPEIEEHGVGSFDLSYLKVRGSKRKTSSKCVGAIFECVTGNSLNKNISPIVTNKSGSTSPKVPVSMLLNNIALNFNEPTKKENIVTDNLKVKANKSPVEIRKAEAVAKSRILSSQSIITNIHDFSTDEPNQLIISTDKLNNQINQSLVTVHSKENRIDKEESRSKTKYYKRQGYKNEEQDLKSTSGLRRKFEALKRGLSKRDYKQIKELNSITDPNNLTESVDKLPSPIEMSTSNLKSVIKSVTSVFNKKSISDPKMSYHKSANLAPDSSSQQLIANDNDDSGVKGMFKLWGKKFNFDDEEYAKNSYETTPQKDIFVDESDTQEKLLQKNKKKFFLFRRRKKNKINFKNNKTIITGCCQLKEGLMIRMGPRIVNNIEYSENTKKVKKKSDFRENTFPSSWLQIFQTKKIESGKSVHIRWNNATFRSSSTVFELINNVYNDADVIFKSKSEIMASPKSKNKKEPPCVNFINRNIEAWMVQQAIVSPNIFLKGLKENKCDKIDPNYNLFINTSKSNKTCFDQKSEAHTMGVVLHSKNFVSLQSHRNSNECLKIDIPNGFFNDSSYRDNIRNSISDEKVSKIVDYEIPTTNTQIQAKLDRRNHTFDTGDHEILNEELSICFRENNKNEALKYPVRVKKPLQNRDVVIQGSNVNIMKRCDVIGVGIIAQRDADIVGKPILRNYNDDSGEESHLSLQRLDNKCKFAESYLREYYRQWMPLGIDFYSWCVSDSHIHCSSINNTEPTNYNSNQEDSARSCPNLFDDYHAAAEIVASSLEHSCCSDCPEEQKPDEGKKAYHSVFFKKLKSWTIAKNNDSKRRVLPKDSLEVFKRRKVYALSKQVCNVNNSVQNLPENDFENICRKVNKDPNKKHVYMLDDNDNESSECKETMNKKPYRSKEPMNKEPCGSNEAKNKKICGSNEAMTNKPCGAKQPMNKTPCESNEAMTKKTCDVKQPMNKKPCGANEAMNKKPCGSKEAANKKPIGSNEAMNKKPCTSNEAMNKKPCGSNEAMNKKPCGLKEVVNKKPCGSNEAMNKKPCGSNEAMNKKPCGSNEAMNKKPCGSNKAINKKPCGSNEAMNKKPCGSKEAVNKKPCGSNKAMNKKPCGSNEAMNKKPCGSNEAMNKKPCASNEVMNKKPCGSKEAVNKKPCGSNEAINKNPCGLKEAVNKKPCGSNEAMNKKPCGSNEAMNKNPCGSNEAMNKKPCGSNKAINKKPCGSNEAMNKKPCGSKEAVNKKPCGSNEAMNKKVCGSKEAMNKKPCGSKEAMNKKPCGSNEAMNKKPCGSNEAINKKPCGSNEAMNKKPCGSNEAMNKKPYGSNEAMNKKACGSNEAMNKKPCGSNEAMNKKPCGSNEAMNKKLCGSNEAMNKKPCGSTEAVNKKPCGSNEVINKKPCGSNEAMNKKPCGSNEAMNKKPCGSKEAVNKKPCEIPSGILNFKKSPKNPKPTYSKVRIHPTTPNPSSAKKTQCKKPSVPCKIGTREQCNRNNNQTPSDEMNCANQFPWPLDSTLSNDTSDDYGEMEQNDCCSPGQMSPPRSPPKCPIENIGFDCGEIGCPSYEAKRRMSICPSPPPNLSSDSCEECCKNRQNDIIIKSKPCSRSNTTGIKLKKLRSKPKSKCNQNIIDSPSSETMLVNTVRDYAMIELNSTETMTIRTKKDTPSTEEIREIVNVQIQDELKGTHCPVRLKEKATSYCNKHEPSVLGDMYQSNIMNANTPTTMGKMVCDREKSEKCESDPNISNVVEIQFKLKVTQGDKNAELKTTHNDTSQDEERKGQSDGLQYPQEIYVVRDAPDSSNDNKTLKNDLNDLNIKIVIHNYNNKNKQDCKYIKAITGEQKEHKVVINDFSRKISEKFRSVSTGYSDTFYSNDNKNEGDNIVDPTDYSVHRATIDLTSSKSEVLVKMSSDISTVHTRTSVSSKTSHDASVTEISTTDFTLSKYDDINNSTIIKQNTSDVLSKEMEDIKEVDEKFKNQTSASSLEQKTDSQKSINATTEDELIKSNIVLESEGKTSSKRSKREKKDALKEILEKVGMKAEHSKRSIKEFHGMLKAVLTSSESSKDDIIAVANIDVLKQVTSCLPSTSKYVSSDEFNENQTKYFPSREQTCSCNSHESNTDKPCNINNLGGCLCSKLAARLNTTTKFLDDSQPACCCRKPKTFTHEETYCDLQPEIDYSPFYIKTEYKDVETQISLFNESKYRQSDVLKLTNEENYLEDTVEYVKRTEDDLDTQETEILKSVIDRIEKKQHPPNKLSKCMKSVLKDSVAKRRLKGCPMKILNKDTILGLSSEDRVVVLSCKPKDITLETMFFEELKKVESDISRKTKRIDRNLLDDNSSAEILQSYETKKAVLEIYAEKTVSDHLVAKLPKFVSDENNNKYVAEMGKSSSRKF